MSNIFGGNSNLPPGCRVSDIPGNTPEDEAWETIIENFWNKERIFKRKFGIQITEKQYALSEKLYASKKWSEAFDTFIILAIEYGIDIGGKQEQENQAMNKMYKEQLEHENQNPKTCPHCLSSDCTGCPINKDGDK